MNDMHGNIDAFFMPQSIALVGASENEAKGGARRLRSIVESGYQGKIYPVHPKLKSVLGHEAFPTVVDIPGPVDLAIIIVPPLGALEVAKHCAEKRVKAVILITAGFAETGEEGANAEAEIVRILAEGGCRLIGPNCAGAFSAPARLNAIGWDVPFGNIGLISQSGNVALDLSNLASSANEGFSYYMTIGNAADVRAVELLDYMLDDSNTHAIIVYLEGWREGEGRAFFNRLKANKSNKPVILLIAGKTASGANSAMSHTRSLAAEFRVASSAFRQAGAVVVDSVADAWGLALLLRNLKAHNSQNIAVLSDGGGHATLVSDEIELNGLTLANFSDATQKKLREILPSRCATINPLDYAGYSESNPDSILSTLSIAMEADEIDAIVLVGHFGGYSLLSGQLVGEAEFRAAQSIVEKAAKFQKPFVVHTIHADRDFPVINLFKENNIPVTRSLPLAIKALTLSKSDPEKTRTAQDITPKKSAVRKDHTAGCGWLNEDAARDILKDYDIEVPKYEVAQSSSEGVAAACKLGFPVVMKLMADDLVHRTEVGGIALNVSDVTEVEREFASFNKIARDQELMDSKILLTGMISGGVEVIVGGYRDIQFGPVIMFGLGGVFVEVLNDVVFRLAPITKADALEMVSEVKGHKLLSGYRGSKPLDTDALATLIQQVSVMLAVDDGIAEIDLNPVFVREKGLSIADVRIKLM